MNKPILLFSGGIDSYVAWHFLNKPPTVYFDLRSRYSMVEMLTVSKLIPNTIIDSSLDLLSREQESAYVPFRNLLLACQAAHYGDTIIMAGNADDVVSDKTQSIFNEFSQLLSKLEGRPIEVSSPFWELSKRQLVAWYLAQHGNPMNLINTVSCYSGVVYCGKCKACFRKWMSLYLNGIDIEFYNMELMQEYHRVALEGERYTSSRNKNTIEAIERYYAERYRANSERFISDKTM